MHPRVSDPDLRSNELRLLRMTFRVMTTHEEGCLKTLCAAVGATLRRVNSLKTKDVVAFEDDAWLPLQRYAAAWVDATLRAMRGLEGPELASFMLSSLTN